MDSISISRSTGVGLRPMVWPSLRRMFCIAEVYRGTVALARTAQLVGGGGLGILRRKKNAPTNGNGMT